MCWESARITFEVSLPFLLRASKRWIWRRGREGGWKWESGRWMGKENDSDKSKRESRLGPESQRGVWPGRNCAIHSSSSFKTQLVCCSVREQRGPDEAKPGQTSLVPITMGLNFMYGWQHNSWPIQLELKQRPVIVGFSTELYSFLQVNQSRVKSSLVFTSMSQFTPKNTVLTYILFPSSDHNDLHQDSNGWPVGNIPLRRWMCICTCDLFQM